MHFSAYYIKVEDKNDSFHDFSNEVDLWTPCSMTSQR